MKDDRFNNIFPGWDTKRVIGSGSYGKVYELERVEGDAVYRSALKVISVPQNDSEIKTRLVEGESKETVTRYYEEVTRNLLNENRVMAELKGNSNIVSYEDHRVIKHDDGIGCDIYIRMELLEPFTEYLAKGKVNESMVIRLGIDICKALEICERKKIIHRDIKPGNIFLSDTGDFKLGDFGIARTIDMTMGGMSKKGTYRYMAPEVYRGQPYGRTVDICSLGLVMYYLMNGNRTPFLPPSPTPISYTDEENALLKRMNGDLMPHPRDASTGLGAIILKACSYDPSARYQSASEMKADLEALQFGRFNGVAAQPQRMNSVPKPIRRVPQRKKSRSTLNVVIASIAAAAIVLIGVVVAFLLTGSGEDPKHAQDNSIATENERVAVKEKPTETEATSREEYLADIVPAGATEHNGHYYMVINESLYWWDAKDACEKLNGHLVTIANQDEQDFIVSLIEQDGEKFNYWLGGTDDGHEGVWEWINGETWGYTNWRSTQPNNRDGDDDGDQNYLQICCVSRDDVERYGYWWDMSNTGVSREYMHAPYYKDTQYSGYICEWE